MLENLESVLSLREEHPLRVASNGKAEKVMKRTQVRHGELGAESGDETLKQGQGRCGEDDVVDVEQEVGRAESTMEDEERRVGLGAGEAESGDEGREAMVPGAGSLLETVKGTVEATHVIRARGVDEAGGLLAEHHLGEFPMKKRVLVIRERAMERIVLIVANFTTGLKVLSKSTPCSCEKPHSTQRAL